MMLVILLVPVVLGGGAHQKILLNYGSGNDGDVLNNMGRSNPHLGMESKQSTIMRMSPFDDVKRWCLDNAWLDGGEHIFNLSN
jgi:hypothetical protein